MADPLAEGPADGLADRLADGLADGLTVAVGEAVATGTACVGVLVEVNTSAPIAPTTIAMTTALPNQNLRTTRLCCSCSLACSSRCAARLRFAFR
ncbi:hypothetical protein FH608_006310 [Nonomuraea phyllanthi]|uniref:Uncharacterized protein n=1 Tax=Nonomuraea phyllanthi TaxID=2219224 RepID=A0A5C4WT33_9ACTN|nr:hypothetical protein [Nonomuraea phyllanthi]KAB8196365.1 hypothetical protein FH608_006310 [Nonomuraea phyllanthi]